MLPYQKTIQEMFKRSTVHFYLKKHICIPAYNLRSLVA